MPTVAEVSALYANFMLAPVRGAGVCDACLTFSAGYERCNSCLAHPHWLDAMAPISYSVAHEQLHHALVAYKRLRGDIARRLQVELAAVLWRYLDGHEHCLADAAGVSGFDLVTTVPSGRRDRDGDHPLRRIVAGLCEPTRERYCPLLVRSSEEGDEHRFDPRRYDAQAALRGQAVLLVDDTWTTGASAQSAAAALKRAGAGAVAAVVIGRHVKRDWLENDARLQRLSRPFDWESCVHCRTLSVRGEPAAACAAPRPVR